jgi:hypothetical protein
VTVWTPEGVETIQGSEEGNGYGLEVHEVERCLRDGLTESPHLPLADTVGILRVIDEARGQLGVVYAADPPAGLDSRPE